MNYQLNTEAAKAADAMNSRIEDTGKYIGVFTRAEAVKSKKNTIGIDMSFKSDDGQTADYLSVWTHNSEGKEIYGFKQLMAIMTCLRLKSLTKTNAVIEKYDTELKQRVKVSADVYMELTGKPIGLLLQREAYMKDNGTEGFKLNLVGFFDAETELTASEILGKKTQPELLAKMVAQLKDKPLSGKQQEHHKAASNDYSDDPFGNMPDDFPF